MKGKPRRQLVQCICGAQLTDKKYKGKILFEHLRYLEQCRDSYARKGIIIKPNPNSTELVIVPTIYVESVPDCSRQWQVVGLGMLGQKVVVGTYYRKCAKAELERDILRGVTDSA